MRARDFAYFDGALPTGLAHRGGAAYAPNVGVENTITAFRRAVDMGFRYLETDVHATRDGVIVAFHAEHLDRVTNTVGTIAICRGAARANRRAGAHPDPHRTARGVPRDTLQHRHQG